MNISPAVKSAVMAAMQEIHGHIGTGELTRDKLEMAATTLRALAAQGHFTIADFPIPEGSNSILYKLSEDEGGLFTLYVNRIEGGVRSPPHDHKTWAVIAAVQGTEVNTLFSRQVQADGREHVAKTHTVDLKDGASIALMPLDVHSIRIEAGEQLLNLHMYGIGIDRQSGRMLFDADGYPAGHYAPQPLIR